MAKSYRIDEKDYTFDFDAFTVLFSQYCKKCNNKKYDGECNLADAINCAHDTVHNWRCRVNAPNDIDMVQKIAEEFKVDKYCLLNERKDGTSMENLTERQICASKRIFDSIIDILFEIKNSFHVFTDAEYEQMCKEYEESGENQDPDCELSEEDTAELAEAAQIFEQLTQTLLDKARAIIAKEYFDLHNTEIYNHYSTFCEVDLDLIVSNLPGDQDNTTHSFYYCTAIKQLHSIIENNYEPLTRKN